MGFLGVVFANVSNHGGFVTIGIAQLAVPAVALSGAAAANQQELNNSIEYGKLIGRMNG